jgi:NADH-quinone oxidoreductase subunit C
MRDQLRRADVHRAGPIDRRGAEFLRDDPRCGFVNFSMIDICGVDYPEREKRFDVVYHLLSPTRTCASASRCRPTRRRRCPRSSVFPAPTGSSAKPSTCTASCSRPSRPAPHPDRLRLRGPSAAQGLPDDRLRRGSLRRRAAKRVVYEPVKLNQEFRNFDFLSPWEGADYVLPGDEKAKVIAACDRRAAASLSGLRRSRRRSAYDLVRLGQA